LIGENEPRYLRQLGFPRNYVGDLEQLLQIVNKNRLLNSIVMMLTKYWRSGAYAAAGTSSQCARLVPFFPERNKQIEEVVSAASLKRSLREVYHEMGSDSSEPDYDLPKVKQA